MILYDLTRDKEKPVMVNQSDCEKSAPQKIVFFQLAFICQNHPFIGNSRHSVTIKETFRSKCCSFGALNS